MSSQSVPDFSPQRSRIVRAEEQLENFKREVALWGANPPMRLDPELSPDRMACTMTLRMSDTPPIDRWGILFGEVVANLRAMLDNLLVNVVRTTGGANTNRLYFPRCRTERDWTRNARGVWRRLPEPYRSVLHRLQPFSGFGVDQNGGPALLTLLAKFNNTDKHDLFVSVDVKSLAGTLGTTFEFEPAQAELAGPPNIEIIGTRLRPDERMFVITMLQPIARVTGTFTPVLEFEFEYENTRYELFSTLDRLVFTSKLVVDWFESAEHPQSSNFLVLKPST